MIQKILLKSKAIINQLTLLLNKFIFVFFFKKRLKSNEYGNSKIILLLKTNLNSEKENDYLIFIRSGKSHLLVNDGGSRNFDLALNLYAYPENNNFEEYKFVFSGGINKYMAAMQFLDQDIISRYIGFMYLDDDIEITYTQLSSFLTYCDKSKLKLAQPSLSLDSYCNYGFLRNAGDKGHREVPLVEVMCPYFSQDVQLRVINTFDLSFSSWGLDFLWAKLSGITPVVIDEYQVRHAKPFNPNGAFYKYMKSIGVSPGKECLKLRRTYSMKDW